MKKTLIALAAVAASTGVLAQVTLSGNVDARFQSAQTDTADKASGFLISDTQIHFTATEDLGGGLTATARFTIDGATSDGNNVAGDGTMLRLSSATLGSLTISSMQSADYLPLGDFYEAPFAHGTVADRVSYQTPTISGFNAEITHQEGGTGAGKALGQSVAIYSLNYAAGPLTANVGVLTADKLNHAQTNGANRFNIGYDFGVARVAYGQVNSKLANDVKAKTNAFSVSAPLAANITVGAQYSTYDQDGVAKRKGTAVNATYALSNRTSILFEKVSYDVQATGFDGDRTRLTLRHSF